MKTGNFFVELKRRNVYKVAVAYAVVGWVIAQIATQIFPFLEIPNWVVRLVIVLIAIGFPIALVIAWAFEATPEGIKRTEVAYAMPAPAGQKRHVWIYVVVIGVAISIGLFFLGRYTAQSREDGRPPTTAGSLPQKSIAVLPFDNLSRDPDNAFFAEGVQDEILTRLAKIADLKVIARTSTQKFKSAPADLREVAKRLDVTNILEGSVQSERPGPGQRAVDQRAHERASLGRNLRSQVERYFCGPERHCDRVRSVVAGYQRGPGHDLLLRSPLRRLCQTIAKNPRDDPTFFYAHFNLGIVLQVMGDLPGAIAEYEKAKQLNDDLLMSTMCAAAKAQAGDKDAALRMLSELDKISQRREVVGYLRALLYLSLNNKEEALRWLEQGFEERDGSNISWINVDPLLDSLHGDPRFEALVQKVIAPKESAAAAK